MEPANDVSHTELSVTFQPPLFLERRGWVFEILRREGVHNVLDVGCGEGDLISCLCNPAPWLLAPPPSVLKSLVTSATVQREEIECSKLQAAVAHESYLHPTKVMGLDISATDLAYAIQGTAPRPQSTDSLSVSSIRWEPFEVEIWQGGLQSINPEFVDVECIVSTEVIEHLPENVLQDFAPIMLGAYHPKLLLITTPSYTFNARFTAPDAPASARSGFLDPTGRTNRIFRHHDHKFEWTIEEFTQWCEQVADEWGYEVEVGGVGKPLEKDDWGRDEELGYASQTAAFRRREGADYAVGRAQRLQQVASLQDVESREQHVLLSAHVHEANEKARQPVSLQEIGDLTKARMIYYRDAVMRLRELWFDDEIAMACGGWIEVFVRAVEGHPDLRLLTTDTEGLTDWEIEVVGEARHDEKVLWRNDVRYEDSDGSTLSSAWTTELESPVPEHPVMGDLEGVKSHWEDSSKDDMVFGDKISPQWPTSTLLPDNWGADEARSWGPAADWGEDVTIPAVDTDAVW